MISIISGALAPSIALLIFIYLKDRYEAEPKKLILKMFIIGAFIVFPAYVIERTLQEGLEYQRWYSSTLGIALIEEFLKWFVIYFMIYKHVEFNEPYDGVVYSAAVAIGFATIENIGYLIFNPYSPTLILLRALLPVSGHAIFGIIMGYFLGLAKFNREKERKYLAISIIFPMVIHSIYNLILSQNFIEWFYIMPPFLLSLWWYGLSKIRVLDSISPFK